MVIRQLYFTLGISGAGLPINPNQGCQELGMKKWHYIYRNFVREKNHLNSECGQKGVELASTAAAHRKAALRFSVSNCYRSV
ncbi:hypothetical protein J6590_037406 [Homalodisca vitripennis]|nr:hypothetical protein J6590_037406 [Homalodisca vitripennis]